MALSETKGEEWRERERERGNSEFDPMAHTHRNKEKLRMIRFALLF